MDQRLEKLAQVLVSYSAAVNKGDIVRIFGPVTARELATSVYRHVIRAGAHPQIVLTPDESKEILLVEGNEQLLQFADPIKQFEIETIDVLISLWAHDNTKALTQIDPVKQALMSQGRKKYLETYLGRAADGSLRWVGTQAPCHAAAQDAEMSLSAYEDFVFQRGHDSIGRSHRGLA